MADKLTAVLVGCGSVSKAWLKPALLDPDLTVAGLVDLNKDTAVERAEEFGLDAYTDTDLKTVLEQTKPDLIFNCTVPQAHAQVTLEALEYGCHVFVEKPLADSMENGHKMIAAAEKAGKLLGVMQNRRYNPYIRSLVSFLQTQELGAVTTVNCDFYIGAHFGGFRETMEHVLLLDMAIHTFDAARLITGADPVSVFCHEWNPKGSWYEYDASAIVLFEMTNDIVYTYRGSWCSEGMNTAWESEWRIVCEKGTAAWDGKETIKAEKAGEGDRLTRECIDTEIEIRSDPSVQQGGHEGAVREFLACVREGRIPETAGSDNIKSLAMVFSAIESAESGKKIDISL
jgi:predicted dehydrogenase